MDARFARTLLLVVCTLPALMGAGFRTENFVVDAPTPEIATQVGVAAEHFRKELAIEWLGYELKPWSAPCPIKVKVGQIGAGGETRFSFYPKMNAPAEVAGWDMRIQGSLERILDSVLPHEISHTIFACHFRRPLPRWADEGAATLAEHESERRRQVLTVNQVINTRRRITLKNLLNIKEYPKNFDDVMTLYAEGYTLAQLLVQEGGRAKYLQFLTDAHKQGWDKAIETHYGFPGIDGLEKHWHSWVMAGCPENTLPEGQMLADNTGKTPAAARDARNANPRGNMVVRGQSPEGDPFLDFPAAEKNGSGRARNGQVAAAPQRKPLPVTRDQSPSAVASFADQNRGARGRAAANIAADDDESEWVVDEARVASTGSADEQDDDADDRRDPRRTGSQRRPREFKVAELRIPAGSRQRTPWSEFPGEPRPNPFADSPSRRSSEP
ncbi:MAG: hypothetical protein JSS02_17155 [Planctomycetes bacterium]|nr:hypothetical protein [Planctomycetota bacterium]